MSALPVIALVTALLALFANIRLASDLRFRVEMLERYACQNASRIDSVADSLRGAQARGGDDE